MSLRAFHILFIVASVLLSLVMGTWGVQRFLVADSTGGLGFAVAGFLAGLGLLLYARSSFAKLKRAEEAR